MWMPNGIAPAMPPAIADMRHGGLVPPAEGSISAKCFGHTTRPSGAYRISLRAKAVPQTAQVSSMRVASHGSVVLRTGGALATSSLDRAGGSAPRSDYRRSRVVDFPASARFACSFPGVGSGTARNPRASLSLSAVIRPASPRAALALAATVERRDDRATRQSQPREHSRPRQPRAAPNLVHRHDSRRRSVTPPAGQTFQIRRTERHGVSRPAPSTPAASTTSFRRRLRQL